MQVKIKSHPNSSQEKIVKINDFEFEIWIKEKAIDGKANARIVKLLKEYFNKSVRIKSGENSRRKIIELE